MGSIKIKLIIVLCAIGVGIFLGLQTPPKKILKETMILNWDIPNAYKISSMSKKASTVKGFKLWLEKTKRKGKGKSKPKSKVQWDFLGSVKVNSSRQALIKIGNEVKRFKIGDSLPDATVIKEILIDILIVKTKDGDINHLLFH